MRKRSTVAGSKWMHSGHHGNGFTRPSLPAGRSNRSGHRGAFPENPCRALPADDRVQLVEDGGDRGAFVGELMLRPEQARKTGPAPHADHLRPWPVKVQIAAHRAESCPKPADLATTKTLTVNKGTAISCLELLGQRGHIRPNTPSLSIMRCFRAPSTCIAIKATSAQARKE